MYAVAWYLQKEDRGQMPQADINFPREEEEIWGRGEGVRLTQDCLVTFED